MLFNSFSNIVEYLNQILKEDAITFQDRRKKFLSFNQVGKYQLFDIKKAKEEDYTYNIGGTRENFQIHIRIDYNQKEIYYGLIFNTKESRNNLSPKDKLKPYIKAFKDNYINRDLEETGYITSEDKIEKLYNLTFNGYFLFYKKQSFSYNKNNIEIKDADIRKIIEDIKFLIYIFFEIHIAKLWNDIKLALKNIKEPKEFNLQKLDIKFRVFGSQLKKQISELNNFEFGFKSDQDLIRILYCNSRDECEFEQPHIAITIEKDKGENDLWFNILIDYLKENFGDINTELFTIEKNTIYFYYPKAKMFIKDNEFFEELTYKDIKNKTKYAIKVFNNIKLEVMILKLLSLLKSHKNLILQGPPGTGKTYLAQELAVRLASGDDQNFTSREEIMKKYKELKTEKQIAFVTFHQSYDYEDFVIGYRPETDDKGNMIFTLRNGILKQLADRAKYHTEDNFQQVYQQFIQDISDQDKFQLKTKTGKTFAVSVNSKGNLTLYTGPSLKQNGTLTAERMRRIFYNENIDPYWRSYYEGVLNYLQDKYGLHKSETKPKNYVLIIDEINRGNIAKIFGELITLLERDKRVGATNAETITLPYTDENGEPIEFSLPPNLYIIGTMNTADRSLGRMDYALRRRFVFVTLKPNPQVIKNYYSDENLRKKAKDYFEKVNKLIDQYIATEFSSNKNDFKVGHSYFLVEQNAEDKLVELNNRMLYEVIPLLEEYLQDGVLKPEAKEQIDQLKTEINPENTSEE